MPSTACIACSRVSKASWVAVHSGRASYVHFAPPVRWIVTALSLLCRSLQWRIPEARGNGAHRRRKSIARFSCATFHQCYHLHYAAFLPLSPPSSPPPLATIRTIDHLPSPHDLRGGWRAELEVIRFLPHCRWHPRIHRPFLTHYLPPAPSHTAASGGQRVLANINGREV